MNLALDVWRTGAALDALPRRLWRWGLVCSAGDTTTRLDHSAQWLQALQMGRLPLPTMDMGDAEASAALRSATESLDLPALCSGRPAIAEQLLQSLFWHLDSLIDRPAAQSRAEAIAAMAEQFAAAWTLERQDMEHALALMPDLGRDRRWRWDTVRGQMQRREWQDLERIAAVLQRLPALEPFLRGVGRTDPTAGDLAKAQRLATASDAAPTQQGSNQDEREPQPAAVDGVRHSRELARMAGAEALGLRHPVLRRLWRARFAEARLLTYDDRSPPPPLDTKEQAWQADAHTPQGLGPLLVCLDTSGSMRGAPEAVAKACVLQALRSAQAQGRGCTLIAFGGPGDLLCRALDGDAGLEPLLDLMGQGFDGGTDVQTPIEHAMALVQQQAWTQADVLIVSDGEFGLTPAARNALRQAKRALGLRVHGVLIGDRETIGLVESCDRLHWVRDWRRYAEGSQGTAADGFSPVHSRNLTALYFPNAIQRG
jgi:uncharacterized protein with von Willebrand factor type A (vWA) domain